MSAAWTSRFCWKPKPALKVCAPFDYCEVVVQVGNLFLKAIAHGDAAAEICDAGDVDLRPSAGERIGYVLLIAIRPAEAEFVQNVGREGGKKLRAEHMGAVAEVRGHAERVEAADIGVKRVLIAEVVVANEELMLRRDDPVEPGVDPLRVFDGRRVGEQIGRNSDQRPRWPG